MRIVEHSIEWVSLDVDGFVEQCHIIERAGRCSHKSEDKITQDSHKTFIKMIIDRGHEAVLEFGDMTVKLRTDRGITHELVRHRLCSFIQESTRYVDYGDKAIDFIQPHDIKDIGTWISLCAQAERVYKEMLFKGESPQMARSVLPTCTASTIWVKANFREWRHIFKLRVISKVAHPDMRLCLKPLYIYCKEVCPEVFDLGDLE